MQQPMDLDPEAPPPHSSDKGDNKSDTNSPASHAKTRDAPPSSGHPSPAPSSSSAHHNELYDRELSNFNAVLASISPAAARAGVRQNWRKCLLGSSSDESFFIRSLMGRTSDHVMTRVLEDEQGRILEVASEHYKKFLDRAMAMRLETISAKDLVAVLAKAKRLGYDEMDLVEADEIVVPAERAEENEPSDSEEAEEKLQVEVPEVLEVESGAGKDSWAKERLMEFRMKQQGDARQASQTVFSQTEGLPKRKTKRKICPACGASFLQSAGLKYHMDRKVCERQRPTAPLKFWCEFCSKGFTTSGGLTYHRLNNVCKGHETSSTTSPNAQLHAEQASKYAEPPRNITPKDVRPEPYPGALNVRTYSPPQNAHAQMPAARFSEFKASPKPLPMHSSPQQYQPHTTPTSAQKAHVALTTEQFAEMNAKLEKEERRFESVLAKVSPHLSSSERHAEIKRLKAGSSTRKSIIRREYGVQVRRSKVATANAIRTASGGVDVPMVDTPPSTNGFAAINRIASFRAEPEHDSKRRRTGEVEIRGRNPSMYDPLRDNSERSRSVDEYPRPGYNGAQRLPQPDQMSKSDNRPTTAERQNGIIPRSRPPQYAEQPSRGTPQHDPYRQSSYQQHQTPTGGFTSVNTEQSASRDRHEGHAAPQARMEPYGAAAPFYVDQERRGEPAHQPYNHHQQHDAGGTFGVLRSKKVPVREAQAQWETQQSGSGSGGHYGGQLGVNGAEKRSARTGDLIEILSDSSSYSRKSPSEKPAAPALQKPTPATSSAASSIP
ncbi:hypothetical protein V492_05373, partial [Pseudogymnoascus sp. VKM F-4246]